MSWFDGLKLVDILIGLLITGFGGGYALLVWLHGRMQAAAQAATASLGAAQARTAERLDAIECDLKAQAAEAKAGREAVSRLDNRVTSVERAVAVLPSKDDFHALALTLARIDERLKSYGASVERIQEWLTEQGR